MNNKKNGMKPCPKKYKITFLGAVDNCSIVHTCRGLSTVRKHFRGLERMNCQYTLGIILLSSMLVACGSSGSSELNHYINDIKTRKSKPIEPLPEFTPLPKFIFPEQDNRRSPFKARVVRQADTFSPNVKRPKQPLEAFPLDALKFVGILKQGSTVWALIKQPDGVVSRVKPGEYMGQNYGQVIAIKDKFMKVEEAVQVAGKWEKRDVTINLKMPD